MALVQGCRAPLLSAADEKARVAHAERNEDVLPKIDFERLVADGLHQLTDPIHSDSVLPAIPRIEFQRRSEGTIFRISDVRHPGHLFIPEEVLAPDRIGEARCVGQQVTHGDRALGGTQPRLPSRIEAFQNLRRPEFGKDLGRELIESQLTLLNELHAGRSSDRLGH